MKRCLRLLLVCALLFGCNSQPIAGWAEASYKHLDRFKEFFMAGEEPLAEAHFQKAVAEIKKSGDLSALQKAYLTKYAVHLAVLKHFTGDEYLQVEAVAPIAENRNFFAFLRASPAAQVSAELLPRQYREFFAASLSGEAARRNSAVAKIEDPLSRLIAIGWLVSQDRHDEEILLLAEDTASRQGWKKALLAYLDRLTAHYLAKGETKKAEAVEGRIRLMAN